MQKAGRTALPKRKIPHFAHFSTTWCRIAKPESERHQALKWLCKAFFAPLPVVWEVPLGERRIDAMVAGLFAVECQVSPLTPKEWQARTVSHNRLGFPVLWIWDVKRLARKNTFEEAFLLEKNQRPVWTPPEIRLCHEESRDLVFVADKHEIMPCRLLGLNRAEQAAAKKSGRGWADAFFGFQAMRKLAFFPEFDKSNRFHFASRSKKFRLVGMGDIK